MKSISHWYLRKNIDYSKEIKRPLNNNNNNNNNNYYYYYNIKIYDMCVLNYILTTLTYARK